MPKHHETRELPYSAAQLFDLVADIGRYPEFLPWCKRARIISADQKLVTADLVIGYKIFQEKFTSVVTLDRPKRIAVAYQSGPLAHLSNEWLFQSLGRKKCAIEFKVDFDFHSPFLRAAMDIFFDKALRKMVEAFELRAQQLYGGE